MVKSERTVVLNEGADPGDEFGDGAALALNQLLQRHPEVPPLRPGPAPAPAQLPPPRDGRSEDLLHALHRRLPQPLRLKEKKTKEISDCTHTEARTHTRTHTHPLWGWRKIQKD